MRKLQARVEGRQFTLSRRRAASLPPVAGMAALAALALRLCFLHTQRTGFSPAQTQAELHTFAAIMLILCVPFLLLGLSSLRAQEWVFDWGIGLVLLNGGFVCRFEDIHTVHLDRDYCRGRSSTSTAVLYLRTWAGVDVEMAREGLYGVGKRELEQTADAVCGFLGIALVTPDRYRAGLWETSGPEPAPTPVMPESLWAGEGRPDVRERRPLVTDAEFAEELRLFRFRDWRFEPLFVHIGPVGTAVGGAGTRETADRADCWRLGVRVCYPVAGGDAPGGGCLPSRQAVHFFDVSTASRHRAGWRAWVREFLWRQVRGILRNEAHGQTL